MTVGGPHLRRRDTVETAVYILKRDVTWVNEVVFLLLFDPFSTGDEKVLIPRCCFSNDTWLSIYSFHVKLSARPVYFGPKCAPVPHETP